MKRKTLIAIAVTMAASLVPMKAQVVSSINQQNMDIPTTPKPDDKGKEEAATTGKAVNIDTSSVYYQLVDSAQTQISAKNYDAAEEFLRKAVRAEPANPNNSLLLSNLATLQRMQGHTAEAIKNYTLAIDLTPNATALLINRAAAYMEIDSMALARADLEHVVKIDPSVTEAHYNLGLLALDGNDFKEAEKQFDEILRYDPKSLLAKQGQGMLYKMTGNYARAADCYSEVIKAQPTANLLANRADCYLTMNRLNDAEEDLRNALQITPDDGYLYLLRAKLDKLRYQEADMQRDMDLAVKHGIPLQQVRHSLGMR